MRAFPASYAGRCANCHEHFEPGAMVGYEDGALIGLECCGEADEPRPPRPQPEADKVMPRGATIASKCPVCFQIPASNRVCGCP